MKKSFSVRRLGAATALTAITLVGAGLAIAPTASANTPAAPASHATPDGSPGSCTNTLGAWGYSVTPVRIAICATTYLAAFKNQQAAFASCVPAMIGTGVGVRVSSLACAQAAYA